MTRAATASIADGSRVFPKSGFNRALRLLSSVGYTRLSEVVYTFLGVEICFFGAWRGIEIDGSYRVGCFLGVQ